MQATRNSADGLVYVTFAVTIMNVGSVPVYIQTSSAGVFTSIPTNSSVLQVRASSRTCLGTVAIDRVNPSQNYTLYGSGGPGTCATSDYLLSKGGSVTVGFSFNWGTNDNGAVDGNSTTISARFVFP